MKYIMNEAKEKNDKAFAFKFHKGIYLNKCCFDDSLYLHEDIFDELPLYIL